MEERTIYEDHLRDLRKSGLRDPIIRELNIYSVGPVAAAELINRQGIPCNCLVFPYPDTEPLFIRLKPFGVVPTRDGRKPPKYLQAAGTPNHLYMHSKVRDALNDDNCHLPVLFVEGEKKCAKATQDLFIDIDEPMFLPIGLGGVNNWKYSMVAFDDKTKTSKKESRIIPDMTNIVWSDRDVYICFDNDIEVKEQVEQAESHLSAYLLSRGANSILAIRLPYGPQEPKGLDDFLTEKGVSDFKILVSQADSGKLLKFYITTVRKKYTGTEKLDLITEHVIRDHYKGGTFFRNSAGAYYYNNFSHKLYDIIRGGIYDMNMADRYGLYRNDREGKSVFDKIQEEAYLRGTHVDIKTFSYYEDDMLYVYDNDGGMYVCTPQSVEYHYNGYNNVLFSHNDINAKFVYIPECKGYIDKYLLSIANFVGSESGNESTTLSYTQQLLLFRIWLLSVFFPNMLPTKPILVMVGDFESGKSTLQRLVGKLLFGADFDVSTIKEEKDFNAQIITKHYLVYDNADINKEWVQNAIASLATGFKIGLRKLYTTADLFEASPICYLAMNAMSDSLFKRPDVASRLLLFRTKALPHFMPTSTLNRNVVDHRNEMLSELIDTIRESIPFITPDQEYKGKFRMMDFANLGFKLCKITGDEHRWGLILDKMVGEQQGFSVEDNSIVDLLDIWVREQEKFGKYSEGVTATDLFKDIKNICDREFGAHSSVFSIKQPIGLGKFINKHLKALQAHFYIKVGNSGNRKVYIIRRKDESEKEMDEYLDVLDSLPTMSPEEEKRWRSKHGE